MPSVAINECHICGSEDLGLYKEVNGFSVLRCNRCGLKWVEGANKSEILSFYEESYFNNDISNTGYEDYLSDQKNHRENSRRIIKKADSVKDLTGARILDIGCAFGFLLDEAKRLKQCNACGIETSIYASSYARDTLGLNVIDSDDLSNFGRNFFDAVFLIGTIEHLVSPRAMLEGIRRILRPDGILVITTLDTRGLIPLYSIKPPEHLFYFDHDNLELLLRKTGYKTLLRESYFSRYRVHDLFRRLSEFTAFPLFDIFSRTMKRFFPAASITIPTNEMLVIARREDISS